MGQSPQQRGAYDRQQMLEDRRKDRIKVALMQQLGPNVSLNEGDDWLVQACHR